MDSETPGSLFMETTDVHSLKPGNLDLQAFASIGGWTFSGKNSKTQPVFGNIAKNEGNRQNFADNVFHLVHERVWIWWHWYCTTLAHLIVSTKMIPKISLLSWHWERRSIRQRKASMGSLSTVPKSYWYLRWFDLPGMLKHADSDNVMSYELHGTSFSAQIGDYKAANSLADYQPTIGSTECSQLTSVHPPISLFCLRI